MTSPANPSTAALGFDRDRFAAADAKVGMGATVLLGGTQDPATVVKVTACTVTVKTDDGHSTYTFRRDSLGCWSYKRYFSLRLGTRNYVPLVD